MKKLLYLVFLVAIVWLGYTLGRVTGGEVVVGAERDIQTEFPLPPPPPEDEDIPDFSEMIGTGKLIVVELPVGDAEVDGVLRVTGRADGSFDDILVTLKGVEGELLLDEEAAVTGANGEVFGRFSVEFDLTHYEPGDMQVIVTGISNTGVRETITRDISLVRQDAITVKVYFANGEISDAAGEDICANVHPVKRTVSSRSNIYRSVIERLADGPTRDENDEGYTTSLPSGVVLRSVAADADGVVTADFTSTLERGVAGSCRVTSIREQIEQTLSQFPEVRDVVITVNGEEETALQP